MRAGDGGILASRGLVVSVVLGVVFVALGIVGWTSGAFWSAAANDGNNWSADTLAPPSGFSVTQSCSSVSETIAFRGATSGGGTEGALTIARPSGVVAGDVLIAQVANRGMGTVATAPPGWTVVRTDLSGASGASVRSTVYWRVATGSEPASYTWTLSESAHIAGGIAAYTGVSTASPVDVAGGRVGSSITATTPQVTTTVAGTRLVHLFVKRQEILPTPSGTSLRWALVSGSGAQHIGATGVDEGFAGPGTTPARSTSGSTTFEWAAQTVALRPHSTVTAGASASWTATPSTFATGYKLRRYVGTTLENEQVITPRTTTTATDSPLVNGTAYTYKLVAYHGNWSSPELTAPLTPAC
jgi:hypothetical protein